MCLKQLFKERSTLFASLLVGLLALPVRADVPLFTFVQASDSQPITAQDQLRFEDAFSVISEAGELGALLPFPVDFVVFPGDLVERDDRAAEWLQFNDTLTTYLNENNIPFFAVPGNHDQEIAGISNYETYVADSGVWDFGSAWFTGQNGRSGDTGWNGLRFIGVNNSNGSTNSVSTEDATLVANAITSAEAAGENVFIIAHHAHNSASRTPLATQLESLNVVGYLRGHIDQAFANQGLPGITNPNVWEVNSNSIKDIGVIVYYEVYQTYINAYVLQLAFSPSTLPVAAVIDLPQPLTVAVPDVPVAALSAAPLAGNAPLEVRFVDQSTGPATTWLWEFGDGATSTLKNPIHTYASAGAYNVTLTASNSSGTNVTTANNLVTVAPSLPIRQFIAAADARVRSTRPDRNYGSESQLRIRAGDPEHRSFLRFDVAGIGASEIISASLQLSVSDGSNSGGSVYLVSSGWDESTINFNNAPSISGPALSSLGDINTSAVAVYDVTPAITGDGSYSFALTTSSTNSAFFNSRETATPPILVVEVGDPVAPTAAFSASPLSGTAPRSVSFIDQSQPAADSWLWDFGDGATSSSPDPVHVYEFPGSYSVSLTASNSAGSDSLTQSNLIQVFPPVQPQAQFSVDVISGSAPLTVTFENQSTGNPTAWSWDFGDGAVSSEQAPVHTYAAAGEYTVALTASNAAGSDTQTQVDLIEVGASAIALTIEARDDALVRSSRPDRNYGALDHIRVRDATSGYQSFMQFEIAGLQGNDVSAATLKLLATDGSSSGGTLIVTDTGWDEASVTFDTAPASTGSFTSTIGAVAAGDLVEIDVTSAINGEGLLSFGLVAGSSNSALYSSKEGLQAPALELVLAQPSAPVAAFSASPVTGSAPHSVDFIDTSSGPATSWNWEFGDGNSSSDKNPSHTYTFAGSYSVTLTASNALGSDTTTSADLVVIAPPSDTLTINVSADARVRSDSGDKNYGGDSVLRVRGSQDIAHRSFLQFDVAGVNVMPVSSVTLRLYVTDGSTDGGSLYVVDSSWTESTITYNNAPVMTGQPVAQAGLVIADTWIDLDVTSVVTADGTYSFGMLSNSTNSALFSSREGNESPRLIVEFE